MGVRLDQLLPKLKKHGVTLYRETDARGKVIEIHMTTEPDGAIVPAKKSDEDQKDEGPKLPKDAARLALVLGSRDPAAGAR